MSSFAFVLFHTQSAALKAERALQKAGVAIKLVPTPRDLSSDCGVAVRFDCTACDCVRAALAASHVPYDRIAPA